MLQPLHERELLLTCRCLLGILFCIDICSVNKFFVKREL
ncbi:hypothetical protein T11_2560 [Trichinella zimbabwensis]|uniref:Uncharacterized protein n=1 Tax=Trichinella zimbabwensis TaxID=268475 RepID=A0A0V1G8Q1_9BILA|nr:hypothetical protein T11_2560 [Trichinella zimbabwensis]